jgi:hypothetical protein
MRIPGQQQQGLKQTLWSVFDRPIWRDWIAWLFFASLALRLASAVSSSNPNLPFDPVSGLIDATVTVGVNYFVFAVVPSAIRRSVRRRRGSLRLDYGDPLPLPDAVMAPPSGQHQLKSVSEDRRETAKPDREATSRWKNPGIRAATVLCGATLLLFGHGNWEYRRMLSDIEGAERVLEAWSTDAETLNEGSSKSPFWSADTRAEYARKWEQLAGESETELEEWRDRLGSIPQAPWNRRTKFERDLVLLNFKYWSQLLRAYSLNYSAEQSTRRELVASSFDLYCAIATDKPSLMQMAFAWPTRSSEQTRKRVNEICRD